MTHPRGDAVTLCSKQAAGLRIPVSCDSYMGYPWVTHGLPMGYPWVTHGLPTSITCDAMFIKRRTAKVPPSFSRSENLLFLSA